MRFLKKEEISSRYCVLASSVDQLSESVRQFRKPYGADYRIVDYVTPLLNGAEWLFDCWRVHQPNAYEALFNLHPFVVIGEGERRDLADPNILHGIEDAFVATDKGYFVFSPYFADGRFEQCKERHVAFSRFSSLPLPISEAYYARMDGMSLPGSLPAGLSEVVFPSSITSGWMLPESYCGNKKKDKATMKAVLESVADPAVDVPPLKGFRCFLNARDPACQTREGDYFFVQEKSKSQRIFHLPDCDYSRLRLVENPVEMMDQYVAWVFRDGEGRFPFNNFSVPV